MHYLYILGYDKKATTLTAALDPYSYDNSEVFEFKNCTEEVEETWANRDDDECLKKYKSKEELANDFYGYTKTENGEYGFYHNPNGLFDWHCVGGRWDGFLNGKNEMNLKEFKEWLDSDNFAAPYGIIFNSLDNNFVLTAKNEVNMREVFNRTIKDLDENEDWCFTAVDFHD